MNNNEFFSLIRFGNLDLKLTFCAGIVFSMSFEDWMYLIFRRSKFPD